MNTELDQKIGDLCEFARLDNGIYYFAPRTSTRAAADSYLAHTENVFLDCKNERVLRFLIDTSAAVPPLNYLMPRMRQLFIRYPNRPHTRSAMLVDSGIMSLMAGMINLLGTMKQGEVRYFKSNARDEAVAWLLSGE